MISHSGTQAHFSESATAMLTALGMPEQPREARILINGRSITGVFDNIPNLLAAVEPYDGMGQCYVSLNPPTAPATNKLGKGAAISDSQIARRVAILFDIDPTRPAGVSATKEERGAALALADKLTARLSELGFPDPLTGMSGNGAYAIYRVDLPNDEASTTLIKRCLEAAAAGCDNDKATIDTSVHNASRIAKLLGTLAVKGDNTEDRPHCHSYVIDAPEPLEVTPIEALQKLAELRPAEEAQADSTSDDEIVRLLEGVGAGERNAAKCRLIGHFLGKGLPPEEVKAILKEWPGKCNPPFPVEELNAAVDSLADKDAKKSKKPESKPLISFLDIADLAARKPPEYIITGVIQENTTALLTGDAASFKTFVAIEMACAITCGKDWLGHGAQQGTVVYVAAEGAGGFYKRIKAWCKAREVAIPAGRLKVIEQAVNLRESLWVDELIRHIEAMEEKPRLVVFDTLARNNVGGNENDAGDMTTFWAGLDRVREVTGGCVLALHHHSKAGGEARGSTVLRGNADTILSIKREKEADTATISCTKQKDAEEFKSFTVCRRVIETGFEESSIVLDPATGAAGAGAASRTLRVLEGLHSATVSEWEAACKAVGVQRSTFYEHKKELMARKAVLYDKANKMYCPAVVAFEEYANAG